MNLWKRITYQIYILQTVEQRNLYKFGTLKGRECLSFTVKSGKIKPVYGSGKPVRNFLTYEEFKTLPRKTRTKGNVIIQNIKKGDKHFEYQGNQGMKCEVLSIPKWDGEAWEWKSKNLTTGRVTLYRIVHHHTDQRPMLYDYPAFQQVKYI